MHDGLAVTEPAVTGGPAVDGGDPPAGPPEARTAAPDLLPPELLQAAVAGDQQAVALLLSRVQPQVERFCRARLGRRETTLGSADDVAQDVCMAVLAVLPDYRLSGMSFRAFVFGIARHKIADAFRAMARNRCDAVEELPERIGREEDPEQVVLDAERNDRLTDLLGILGRRQVEILTLRIAVGLTAEETADALGSTPGAVRVAQHRALQRLRRELEERAARRDGSPVPAAAH
ncbi:RNA polymerase sigma factor ShbA, partial [Pseudonocardia kongjuensis]|uniref:RNA polymerase sigma factor ShbA n=1 Tax=Pseudonocardia kongjuensis TaxID=102227 RepID=UPI0031D3CD4B